MNAEYFVYTRTKNVDYKLIFSPSDSLCTSDVRKDFLSEIRGVINVERYESCLDAPVWYYSKKGDLVLFGVGCNNRELSEDCSKDFTGRSVRGFFGIIAKVDDSLELPFDIRYFKDFYQQKLCPLWDCDYTQAKQKGISVMPDFSSYKTIQKSTSIGINSDTNKTLIHPCNTSVESLISCAMACIRDVNAIGIVTTREHALDKEYKFMNCIVFDCDVKEEVLREKQTNNNNLWNDNLTCLNDKRRPENKENDKSKKALRLRVAALLAVLALASIIIILMKTILKK